MRGTRGDFKRDADGSDKRFGFSLPPVNTSSNTVAVFESPIDALSHRSLFPDFDGYRLSLGGSTAMLALTHFLDRNRSITRCVVCTDNDEAGHRAAAEIAEKFSITVIRDVPAFGKDWNETLQKIRNAVKYMKDVRKDIRFISSDYKELFRIKDGEKITFTSGYDGKVSERKCRFLDEAHTQIGSEIYHICQWAEICERNGHKYEPAAKQEHKIDVLSAKYGGNLQAVAVPMTETAIKKLVGGKYTAELLYNRDKKYVLGALVRGKDGIAVCGVGGENNDTFTNLHPYNAQSFKRELSPAQRAEPKAETLLGEIADAKSIVAGRDTSDRTAPNKTTEER
jgi:hypothetical protein